MREFGGAEANVAQTAVACWGTMRRALALHGREGWRAASAADKVFLMPHWLCMTDLPVSAQLVLPDVKLLDFVSLSKA